MRTLRNVLPLRALPVQGLLTLALYDAELDVNDAFAMHGNRQCRGELRAAPRCRLVFSYILTAQMRDWETSWRW